MRSSIAVCVGLALAVAASPASAVPAGIGYTAYLADPDGSPYEGVVSFEAELFDAEQGGASVWGPAQLSGVEVHDGHLSLVLDTDQHGAYVGDALTGLSAAWVAFAVKPSGQAWITLSPRQRVLAVPYAIEAGDAQRLGGIEASEFMTATEADADFARKAELAPVATSGSYGDLAGAPDLGGYALTSDLAPVCISGSYEDLAGAPDLSALVTSEALAAVALSGSYGDLTDAPDLATYVLADALAVVALSGHYADLVGLPDLSVYALASGLAVVATTGSYLDLGDAPDPANLVRADGSVAMAGPLDLAGHELRNAVVQASALAPAEPAPGQLWYDSGTQQLRVWNAELWQALAADLAPVALSGLYADLSGTPELSGYALTADLAPVCFSGSHADLLDAPDLTVFVTHQALAAVATSGAYADLVGAPDLGAFATTEALAAVATSGAYADLTGAPDLSPFATTADLAAVATSGAYADLAGAPDLSPFATTADLAAVATSGAYADLAGAPDLSPFATTADLAPVATSGAYADLAGVPDLSPFAKSADLATVATSGAYADLGGLPDLSVYPLADGLSVVAVSGSYLDLLDAPDPAGLLRADGSVAMTGELDLAGHGLRGAVLEPAAEPPASPTPGQVWFDTTTDTLHVRTSTEWVPIGSSTVTTGDLHLTGTLTATTVEADGVIAAGTDVVAALAELQAKLWCVEHCDALRIGDCQERQCDGVAQTCTPSGARPDGSACEAGAGRCQGGVCCVPTTCAAHGVTCGHISDGCDVLLWCGACEPGEVCHEGTCCFPLICDVLGRECGAADDGCGGVLDCGGCPGDSGCDPDGHCLWAGSCGSVVCPELPGYTAGCNAAEHCEYVRTAQTAPWHAYDAWIWVPAGTLDMGSPPTEFGRHADESPIHTVALTHGYFVMKHEIPVSAYEACESAGVCSAPSTADWDGAGWGSNRTSNGRAAHPQNGLSWLQARNFCSWVIPGGRLPTEAEWERAAKGPPPHHPYPWGDEPAPACSSDNAVFDELGGPGSYGCGAGGTWPVGSKPAGASSVGALDMAGNVQEWVEDWYASDYYGSSPATDPTGPASGTERVRRGGAFHSPAVDMRAAIRLPGPPADRKAHDGARCARSE